MSGNLMFFYFVKFEVMFLDKDKKIEILCKENKRLLEENTSLKNEIDNLRKIIENENDAFTTHGVNTSDLLKDVFNSQKEYESLIIDVKKIYKDLNEKINQLKQLGDEYANSLNQVKKENDKL